MSVDIIARAMAAAARSSSGGSSSSAPIGRFADLPSRTIDAASTAIVTSGNTTAGVGRGAYVADTLANSALAAAHPRFCKADAGGRFFRLLPDDEGLIPVACGGALGQATAITNASVDDRAAIQAAEDYRHAIGAAGLRFDARYYAYRRIALPAGTSYFDTPNYVPFRLQSASIWKSIHPAGSDLCRRSPSGTPTDLNDREMPTVYGAWFRGGCIWIKGQGTGTDPGGDVNAFTLDGIRLQGGLLQATSGLTFETLDKPLWQENDQYGGNLTFKNGAGLIGYAGELIYQVCPTGPSGVKRYLYIEDNCIFGETQGSCINTSATLRVGRCVLYNASVGIEGWTGEDGYIRAIFRNCGGSIQGGTVRQAPGEHYYTPTVTGSGRLPLGHVDLVLENCASGFTVGSWITGRIEAIDTSVNFGNPALFESGSRDVNLEIVSWCHTAGQIGAVNFLGSVIPMGCRNLRLKVSLKRTKEAEAAGYQHSNIVWGYGSLGPGVEIEVGAIYDAFIQPVVEFTDWMPKFTGLGFNTKMFSYFDCEANNGGTVPNKPVVALQCSGTASGVKDLNLPTTNVVPGTRIAIANYTRAFANPALSVKVNGSNFASNTDEFVNGEYTAAVFEFSGYKWRVIEKAS